MRVKLAMNTLKITSSLLLNLKLDVQHMFQEQTVHLLNLQI